MKTLGTDCLVALTLFLVSLAPPRGSGRWLAAQQAASGDVSIIADVVYGHRAGMASVFNVLQPDQPNGIGIVYIDSGMYRSPAHEFLAWGEKGVSFLEESQFNEYNVLFVPLLRRLISHGYTVFDLRYGSIPEFPIEEGLKDLRRGIRAIKRKASDFGVDPDRLVLWGVSSGGGLALLLAATPEIGVSSDEPRGQGSAEVAAVVGIASCVDLEDVSQHWEGMGVPLSSLIPIPRESFPGLSAFEYVSSSWPPTLLIHGEEDMAIPVSQSTRLHEALTAAGGRSRLIVVPGMAHDRDWDLDLIESEIVNWIR